MTYQNEDSMLLTNPSTPTDNNDVSGRGQRRKIWKNISTIGLTLTFGFIAFYLYSANINQDSINPRGDNKHKGNNGFINHDVVDEMKLWDDTAEISMKISSDDLFNAKRERHQCHQDKHYSKNTLKAAFELPFVALFKDNKGEKKFEASSITKVGDTYYAICDNSWSISKFDPSLTPFSTSNVQIGNPNREADDSGYEAILHHNDTFFVVRESVEHFNHDAEEESSSSYHAIIEELVVDDDGNDYEIQDQCSCEFEFEGDSKGFEGAFGMVGTDGDFYIAGLCEGNHCSESRKNDAGHGEVVLMKKTVASNNTCSWETVKRISIPKSAYFRDYSDIEVSSSGKVAITTQEDSAMWMGTLTGINDGILDPENLAFNESDYKVFDFPKSNECLTIYCNVEGITFINDEMVMAVSDKMKGKGKQPHWCLEKDQSIHAFVLP